MDKKQQHVVKLFQKCKDLKFQAKSTFWETAIIELSHIYNGCGPDWMPGWLRDKLSDYLEFFEPAFLEHDFSFDRSDKTNKEFHLANKRLYVNCKKLIADEYSWWKEPISKLRRYIQARAIYRACEEFGWSAWLS